MVFHPLVIALYVSSLLTCLMVLYATFFGVQILRRWDISSGSELQLSLERKTYLISTLLTYLLGFGLLSLFLYVFTVDRLHPFFVGAMCAAGSLYVNGYGYPTLVLKLINFLLAGIWLILNYVDNRGYDYPLIKKKYSLLWLMSPLFSAEMSLQANYFLRLRPDIITSCCGTLFDSGGKDLASGIASLPGLPMNVAFFLSIFLTMTAGIYFYRYGHGGYLFGGLSGLTFVVSLLSIFSFISLYVYELPTHHCPFCILQREYGYIGYPLYLALFGSGITGMGTGILMPFRGIASLAEAVPSIQKRLVLASLVLLFLFTTLVTYCIMSSNLILAG